jgi:CheY-like chemotaxis protein
MTLAHDRTGTAGPPQPRDGADAPTPPAWRRLSEATLLCAQIEGITAWNQARRAREEALAAPVLTREIRLDQRRKAEALQRRQRALLARADASPVEPHPLLLQVGPRAVVAHRQPWFRDQVGAALERYGVQVLASLDNGADAAGVVIAEQPDVLVMEDQLPMSTGPDLAVDVRLFSPATIVAAQTASADRMGALLDAGARLVYTRLVPPHDIVRDVCVLVTAPPTET